MELRGVLLQEHEWRVREGLVEKRGWNSHLQCLRVASMTWPSREELDRRMHALVADHLDEIAKRNPEGFDLGVQVFISEIFVPVETDRLLREDAGYTMSRWRVWTSEVGGVTTSALVEAVHDMFEYEIPMEYDSDESDEDEGDDGLEDGEEHE